MITLRFIAKKTVDSGDAHEGTAHVYGTYVGQSVCLSVTHYSTYRGISRLYTILCARLSPNSSTRFQYLRMLTHQSKFT
jgi:hypothetical protein